MPATRNNSERPLDIPKMLQAAAKRMSSPVPCSSNDNAPQISLKVVSDGCCPHDLFEQVTTRTVHAEGTIFLFQVLHADIEVFSDVDETIMTSLIYYNAAMTFKCLVQRYAGTCPQFTGKFTYSAYRLLHRAFVTLNNSRRRSSSTEQKDDNALRHFDIPHLEVMALEAVRHLVTLSKQLGMQKYHYDYRVRFSRQQEAVRSLRKQEAYQLPSPAAGAA